MVVITFGYGPVFIHGGFHSGSIGSGNDIGSAALSTQHSVLSKSCRFPRRRRRRRHVIVIAHRAGSHSWARCGPWAPQVVSEIFTPWAKPANFKT